MSSVKINVTVYDGGRRIDTLADRPVRLMPSQNAGVVYAGEVYPLYADDSISLDDRPVKKSLCYTFVASSASIPYASTTTGVKRSEPGISRWYLESNRFGHYIVFDGSRAAATGLVDRLKKARISVVRWDESTRSADNGEMFDWFIRLDYDGTAAQCRHAVASLIQPGVGQKEVEASRSPSNTTADKVATHEVELLLTKIERDSALERVAELEEAAERAEKSEKSANAAKIKSAKLSRYIDELEAQLAEQASMWSDEVRTLHERLKEVRAERDQIQRPASTSDRIEQLLAAKSSAEDDWQQAAEEAEALRLDRDALTHKSARLEDELELRGAQIEQLTNDLSELEHAERERRTRRQSAVPQGGSYEDFMSRLLPRIELDPDDLDLLRAWPTPRDAIHQLLEIDSGGRPRRSKAVESKQGWTEVPGINTGQKGKENLGRIYFRAVKATGRVRVCMHDKKDKSEQARFIDRLPDV